MGREELLREKEDITKEILKLREDLKIANDSVANAGKSVAFYKVVTPPIIITILAGLIVSKINFFGENNGLVGIIFFVFAISLFITSKLSQKKIKENKEKHIQERIAIQKLLVKKAKRLASIEGELIEN